MSSIAGIGIDLIKMDRIDRAWQRHPERFPAKILGPDELRVFEARAARDRVRGVRYLATRFAAKEAIFKAVGNPNLSWHDVTILNDASGKPICQYKNTDIKDRLLISISHSRDYAVASAIVEK